MSDLVLVAIVGAASSIIVQLIGQYLRRNQVDAETGKTRAEINAMSSSEWRALYKEMSLRLDKVEHELDIAKDYIQYLWVGTTENIRFMEEQGQDPPFRPRRNFRGSDDFDAEEWAWIEGAK